VVIPWFIALKSLPGTLVGYPLLLPGMVGGPTTLVYMPLLPTS